MARSIRKPQKNNDKVRPGLPLSRPCTPQDIIDRARQHGPACVDTLVDVMESGDTAASRITAANSLLDRGFGKVGQPLEVTGKGGGPLAVAHSITPALAEALAKLKGGGDA